MQLRIVAIFFALFFWSLSSGAQTSFNVPLLTGPVIDQVGYLTRGDRQELMQLLYQFNKRGVAQLQVLIVSDLQGLPIEQASIQISDKWKLGSAEKDNGILLLVSEKERAIRIEVGQGLEGAIPDIYAKRIISDQMIPLFRAKRFSAGIVLGVHELLRLADKEFADQQNLESPKSSGFGYDIIVLFVLLILIWVLGRKGGGGGRYLGRNSRWDTGFGGGSAWSGGGGGWSGGGGGFSGGGASGNW